jgi:type VI protein secretion system component VasF
MTTSTTEGSIENPRELAAECRQLAARLEAFPGPYQPPVEEQLAQVRREARRAKIMATVALVIAFLAIVLAWIS